MFSRFKKVLFVAAILLNGANAYSYYTFQDTGDLLAPDRYAVGAELQFRTSNGSGTNLTGRFDGGLNDEWNYRVYAGLGDVDFHAGGYFKWVPIPDYQSQPAMGITFGGLLATYSAGNSGSKTEFAFRTNPFISKSYEASFGQLTPYAALPIGLSTYDGDTDATLQLALGSRLIHEEMLGAHYFGEVGFNLDNAFAYISVGVTMPLNEEYLIDLWP